MDIWLEFAKQGGLMVVIIALLYMRFMQEKREGKTLDALYQAQVDAKEIMKSGLDNTCDLIQAKLDTWRAEDKR